MSALAHKIEARGIPTVVIGLVLPHLEKAKPPRSLFVPFQLGRPLGEPGDAAFQRDVLVAALNLLERTDGPVILETYPHDAPSAQDRPGWRPPVELKGPAALLHSDVAGWTRALTAEMALLAPHYENARASRGRTMVGISQQPPDAWPDYAATVLAGALPLPPPKLPSTALAIRFLADDLKAYYGEAAQASGPAPSSRQLDTWFWTETTAGALLQGIRTVGSASENSALKAVAPRFFVPGPYINA